MIVGVIRNEREKMIAFYVYNLFEVMDASSIFARQSLKLYLDSVVMNVPGNVSELVLG